MTELRKAAEQALEALEIWEKMQPNTGRGERVAIANSGA
jgi:hypothetical protein